VALLAPSHLLHRRSPLHTFGAEVQRHWGSTRGAVPAKQHSQNSSTLHQNNPKSHADRIRTPGRTWRDASKDHFPQHPPREGRFLFLQLLFIVTWTFSVKLLGGGRSSHARRRVLVRVAPTRDGKFSCEAETPRKGFSEELLERASRARRNLGRSSQSNSSEGLLVRGGRRSCERAYSEKLFRDKTISRMNGIPTLEHCLSDLKT
jgi:hypothetical protein